MLYQLPNGKVIYLSVEQFLELTEQDIQYMMSIDFGDHIVNPLHSFPSLIQQSSRTKKKKYMTLIIFQMMKA